MIKYPVPLPMIKCTVIAKWSSTVVANVTWEECDLYNTSNLVQSIGFCLCTYIPAIHTTISPPAETTYNGHTLNLS